MDSKSRAFWNRWEKKRRAELRSTGMPKKLALGRAVYERENREGLAATVGDEAAVRASLIYNMSADGEIKPQLIVAEDDVPQELRSKLNSTCVDSFYASSDPEEVAIKAIVQAYRRHVAMSEPGTRH